MSYTSDFTSRRDRLSHRRNSQGFFTARFWRSLAFVLIGIALGFVVQQHYKQQQSVDTDNPLSQAELISITSANEYTDVVRESIQLPERKIA